MDFWPLCPSLCLLTVAHPSYRNFPFNPLSNILAWRNARSDPPPRLAGHGVLDPYFCLVSAVSDLLSQVFFLSSGCSSTLLKGSHRVQHSARPTGSTLLDRLFFAFFFGPRFLSILSPFLPPFCLPKSTPNRKKSEKMGLQIRVRFCFSFSADFL